MTTEHSINKAAHLITLFLLVILSSIVLFGLFSFVCLSFNPSTWNTEVRILYVIAAVCCYLIIASGIRSQYKKSIEKAKNQSPEKAGFDGAETNGGM